MYIVLYTSVTLLPLHYIDVKATPGPILSTIPSVCESVINDNNEIFKDNEISKDIDFSLVNKFDLSLHSTPISSIKKEDTKKQDDIEYFKQDNRSQPNSAYTMNNLMTSSNRDNNDIEIDDFTHSEESTEAKYEKDMTSTSSSSVGSSTSKVPITNRFPSQISSDNSLQSKFPSPSLMDLKIPPPMSSSTRTISMMGVHTPISVHTISSSPSLCDAVLPYEISRDVSREDRNGRFTYHLYIYLYL